MKSRRTDRYNLRAGPVLVGANSVISVRLSSPILDAQRATRAASGRDDPEGLRYYSFLSGGPCFRIGPPKKCHKIQNGVCVTVMENCMCLTSALRSEGRNLSRVRHPKITKKCSMKRRKLAKGRVRRDSFAIRRTQTESGGEKFANCMRQRRPSCRPTPSLCTRRH